MNKISIKQLTVLVALLLSSVYSFATNDGTTAGSAYLVCGKSGFKLTSTVAIPTNGTIQWFTGGNVAIQGATSLAQTFPALNVDSTGEIIDTTFKVVVYNEAGCASDSGVVYVNILPPPTVHATIDNTAVCSASAAATTLHLTTNTGGTPSLPSTVTYTYAWTTTSSNALTPTNAATATSVAPGTAGTYSYTVAVNYAGLDINTSAANTAGCTSSASTSVIISTTPSKPNASISAL